MHRILPALAIAFAADYQKRVPTGALNRAIRDLQMKQPAPTGKIRYAVQGATEPPTFTLFISPAVLPQTYLPLRRTIPARAILTRVRSRFGVRVRIE